MKLNIGIAGTRGIPNHYGGFEQITSYLAPGLVEKGHRVAVYNSHNHPFTGASWKGAEIIRCYDPEHWMGTAGQFIYDLNCLLDARKRAFDILLIMGYTSCSVWGRLYPKHCAVITNMDGLEWRRTKYTAPVSYFLKYAERLALKYGDHYIADSTAIQKYLLDIYAANSHYIPYGAEILHSGDRYLTDYQLKKHDYFLLMARMEPENNVETILDGFHQSNSDKPFLIIGSTSTRFGKYLVKKYREDTRIRFAGPVFDQQKVCSLRACSYLYFHGHSVGGTNPSLLEAMAGQSLIAAHRNPFNEAITGTDALYFSCDRDVKHIIETTCHNEITNRMIKNNLKKIRDTYNWDNIIQQYEELMYTCLKSKR